MYTLKEKAGISGKEYRLWYKLNENAKIGVRTAVGDTGNRRVQNSLGQGMFGSALATYINIGCANPMIMGGVTHHAVKEKYLGDWVHELGCKESISATIKERLQKQIGKN